MKKIVCLVLIFHLLFLVSCSAFGENDGNNTDGGSVNDNTSEENNGKPEDSPEGQEPDENPEDQEPDEEEVPGDSTDNPGDDSNDNDSSDDEEKVQLSSKTIADYLEYLIGTEYCSDADFLRFVANVDNRETQNVIYVSPDGEGEGDFDDPMSLEDAIDSVKPGDTVYLRGGTYIFKETIWVSKSGTKDKYITVKSYPGERAMLTTTPENVSKYHENGEYIFFGIDGGCSYLIFEDLEIYGATDEYTAAFACFDGGQNHIIFKNNYIHDLKTTYLEGGSNAFLFLGEKKNSINNIALINNSCYNLTLGYSEAVSFAGNCEYCYVIDNKVYDNTNIGIDFYGNAGYCSTESLDQARYCVAAFNEVYNCNSPYADCAGIYVDGGRNCLIEGNLIYNCQYGIEIGSEELNEKYPVIDIVVRNNVMKENSVCAMRIGGYDKKTSGTVKRCSVYNNTLLENSGDYDVIISKADTVVFANNIFVSKNNLVETEFDASYITNLSFINNCFSGKNKLELFDKELNIDELNAQYGKDNLTREISIASDFSADVCIEGCSEYTSKYDFYLYEREKNTIGAVEYFGE